MKISFLLPLVICMDVSCASDAPRNKAPKSESLPVDETGKWIDSFREFRTSIYKKDKKKVREFIDFPLLDSSNEVWYLVYAGDDRKIAALSGTVKPFTEKDLDIYFDSLFTKRFTNCILKLKTDVVWKNGEAQTEEIKEGNISYIMYATHDKLENRLILNLTSNTFYDTGDGTMDKSEYNEVYRFDILPNGKLKFRKVSVAG